MIILVIKLFSPCRFTMNANGGWYETLGSAERFSVKIHKSLLEAETLKPTLTRQ